MSNETNKPSAAAMKAAKGLFPPGEYTKGTILSTAFYIDSELSAERKAADKMAEYIEICGKCECQGHNGGEYTCQKCRVLAAYDAARKGEA